MYNFYSCLAPFLLPFPYFPWKSLILLALFYSHTKPIVFFYIYFTVPKCLKKCQERRVCWSWQFEGTVLYGSEDRMQDCEHAGHIASTARKHREVHEFWCWCPAYFIWPTFCECRPTFRVWFLPSEMPLWEHPHRYAEKCLLDDWF